MAARKNSRFTYFGPLSAAVVAVATLGCQRNQDNAAQQRPDQQPRTDAPEPTQADNQQRQLAPTAIQVSGVGACQPAAGMVNMMSRAVEMADANNDGRISKEEAYSSANFLVGGFFFRADTNGDGTISPEEGREARRELMTRYPALATVLQQTSQATGQKPLVSLASLVDIEYGQPVTAGELREAARASVDQLFSAADANKDSLLTIEEARAAIWDGARAAGRAAFQSADTNNDGKLSNEEFRAAAQAPADVAFRLADRDNDGHLSEAEASLAMNQIVQRIGVPAAGRTSGETEKSMGN